MIWRMALALLVSLVVAYVIATLTAGGEPSVSQVSATFVIVQLCLSALIVALNARVAVYFVDLYHRSQTESHPDRSWLLRALVVLTLTVIAACSWFLVSIAVNTLLGTQAWLRPLNIVVIIAVLTVPIRLLREFQRRERAAADQLRVAEMPGPDAD
jgi:amino acid transporter